MRNKLRFCVTICAPLLMAVAFLACNGSVQTNPAAEHAKRYQLKGKVTSIDKQAKMVNVDAQAIPGFMGAMTMPYPVKPEGELNRLSAGDLITGEIVDNGDHYWLENVVVTGHIKGAQAQ